MTIAYDVFETNILAWAEAVTGLTFYWRERARGHERAKAFGKLNILLDEALGVDEVRKSFDGAAPNGEQIEQTISGNRIIVVSIQVKSRSQRPLETARFHLSKLRTSLRDEVRLAAFRADSIAVVRSEAFQNLDFTEQNRRVSLGNMDVRFATVVNEGIAATTYIETVEVSSTFDPPVSPAIELDNVELP